MFFRESWASGMYVWGADDDESTYLNNIRHRSTWCLTTTETNPKGHLDSLPHWFQIVPIHTATIQQQLQQYHPNHPLICIQYEQPGIHKDRLRIYNEHPITYSSLPHPQKGNDGPRHLKLYSNSVHLHLLYVQNSHIAWAWSGPRSYYCHTIGLRASLIWC